MAKLEGHTAREVLAPQKTERRKLAPMVRALIASAAISIGPGFPQQAQAGEMAGKPGAAAQAESIPRPFISDMTALAKKWQIDVRMIEDAHADKALLDRRLEDCTGIYFQVNEEEESLRGVKRVSLYLECPAQRDKSMIRQYFPLGSMQGSDEKAEFEFAPKAFGSYKHPRLLPTQEEAILRYFKDKKIAMRVAMHQRQFQTGSATSYQGQRIKY